MTETWDIVECALVEANYEVIGSDDHSITVRHPTSGRDFRITLEEES